MASDKPGIQAVLVAEKVTKGAIKFVDPDGDSHLADAVHPYQLYLRHAQVRRSGSRSRRAGSSR